MTKDQKKNVILDFLKHMEGKDVHLVSLGSLRTIPYGVRITHNHLIGLWLMSFKVDRLNDSDKDIEISGYLRFGYGTENKDTEFKIVQHPLEDSQSKTSGW